MHPQFTELTPRWFKRAFIYTGSIGEFRYRFNNDAKENVIHAAVYSQLCYELAADVAEQDFPWNDDGVEALKAWLQSRRTGCVPFLQLFRPLCYASVPSMFTTCTVSGMSLPLAASAVFTACSSPPQQGTSIRSSVTERMSFPRKMAVSFSL